MGNVSAVDVGIDVGSTTTKICALDARSRNLLHTSYERHGARQAESVRAALNSLARLFPRAGIRLALTGSGAAPIADKLGVPFVQEVVANACAVQALYPRTRCAIELGGQDAKMIFFRANETTGALDVADMRMNGSCAGGTGAFIDEIASVLNLPIEQFDAAACRGRTVYDISGRCSTRGHPATTWPCPPFTPSPSKRSAAWRKASTCARPSSSKAARSRSIPR